MTDLVKPSEIESLVGATRHSVEHRGRAVSEEQVVYILHSRQCVDSGIDLRDCAFSDALDRGILEADWAGREDRPVVLGIWRGRLVPTHVPAFNVAQVRS